MSANGPAFKISVLSDGRIRIDADSMGEGVYHTTAEKLVQKIIELSQAKKEDVTREKRMQGRAGGHEHSHDGHHHKH